MSGTARQLELLRVLAQPGEHTLRSLAKRFGVSKHTVQRDLDHLSAAGATITEEPRGQTLLFSLSSPPPPTPTPPLDPAALALAAAALAPFRKAPWCKQLLAQLPLQFDTETFDSTAPEPVHAGGELMVREVVTGLMEHRRVRITYRARGEAGAEQRRAIEPARLRVAAGLTYLDAWTVPDGKLRSFVLHRIVEARASQEPFTPRRLPQRVAFGAVDGAPTPVVVRFAPQVAEFISERRWHPSQVLEPCVDGSVLWHGTVAGEHEFVSWVLSWAPAAELISPPAWRERLHARARAMATLHETVPHSEMVGGEGPTP